MPQSFPTIPLAAVHGCLLVLGALLSPVSAQAQEPPTLGFRVALVSELLELRRAVPDVAESVLGPLELMAYLDDPLNPDVVSPETEVLQMAVTRLRQQGAAGVARLYAPEAQGLLGLQGRQPSPAELRRYAAVAAVPGTDARAFVVEALPSVPGAELFLAGLGEFLVVRAQEELFYAHLDDLEHLLRDHALVQVLTEDTRRALRGYDPSRFRAVLPLVRDAVRQDLRRMPQRLTTDSILEQVGAMEWVDADRLSTAKLGVQTIVSLTGGTHPLEVLGRLRQLRGPEGAPDGHPVLRDPVLREALIIAGEIARQYRGGGDLVNRVIKAEKNAAKAFVDGLAVELGAGGAFPGLPDAQETARRVRANPDEVIALFHAVHDLAVLAGVARENLLEATDAVVAGAQFVALLRQVDGVVAQAGFVGLDRAALSEALAVIRAAEWTYTAWLSADYTTFALRALDLADSYARPHLKPYLAEARRYVGVAAAFADAEDAEQVRELLTAAVEPIGGYRAKRDVATVGLAAYVGVTGSHEWLGEPRAPTDRGWAFGLSAPIGLELTLPMVGTSVTLFGSIIDLGNLISLQVSADSVELAPKLGLEQVFAPGVGIGVGLGTETPVTVLGVVQRVSDYRVVTGQDDESETTTLDALRAGISLGVDVTLFRFWSRTSATAEDGPRVVPPAPLPDRRGQADPPEPLAEAAAEPPLDAMVPLAGPLREPYASVCRSSVLRQTLGFDSDWVSTGALLDKGLLLTAAHNYASRWRPFSGVIGRSVQCGTGLSGAADGDVPRWASSGPFDPGADIRWPRDWSPGRWALDYAVVELANAGESPRSRFRLPEPTEQVGPGDTVWVAGFNAEGKYQGRALLHGRGTITTVSGDGRAFFYTVPTEKGLSGAPVWREVRRHGQTEYVLVGIHVGLDTDGDGMTRAVAHRITEETLRDVRRFALGLHADR